MNKMRLIPVTCSVLCILLMTQCNKPQLTQKQNILLICVDDLRPELNCFGAEYIISPNIDKLASKGTSFLNHFVNAPSCGPSRYTLLTGQYGPSGNNALFLRAETIVQGIENIDPSMPEWFRTYGYTTVSVGKVSHHPGGRGGDNWDDSTIIEMPDAWDRHLIPIGEWEHPRGIMHGLAHGEIRKNAGDMDVFQSAEGDDTIYPDGIITNEALNQLRVLAADKENPFFLAVGIIKPHLPFGAPKSYINKYKGITLPSIAHPEKPLERTTWHGSNEFMKYNRWGRDPNKDPDFADDVRRHYAACVSFADAQVGKILTELKRTGADKNTIVVLWGDHGWHLGEHSIWGKHTLFEESLHSPLIIQYPGLKNRGSKTNALVETIDIFPTLCELAGVKIPEFTNGVSLKKVLDNPSAAGHPALGYWKGNTTIRTETHRLTLHKDGFVELYNHTTSGDEINNEAEKHPELVEELKQAIRAKLNRNNRNNSPDI